MPKLATVIINFNRQVDTLAALQSLARSTFSDNHVLVLNYGLPPTARQELLAAYPGTEVLDLPQNQGYAGNNNTGIKLALARGADWVLVMNEDVIVDPVCVERMVAAGERHPRIGMVGPMVYHFDEPAVIQSAGGVMDGWWHASHIAQNQQDDGHITGCRDVDWLSGCAVLARRQLLEQIGALDEHFFLYWEETEWCMRAKKAGWRIVHEPAARVWHKGVKRDYQPQPYVAYYMTRNRFIMLSKHRAPLAAWLAAWAETLRTLLSYTVRPHWRARKAIDRAMIRRGLRDFLRGRSGPLTQP